MCHIPALRAMGHPQQSLVTRLLLHTRTREQQSVSLLQHTFSQRQRLDQYPRSFQTLAERVADLLGNIAERLDLVHRPVQAALELVGEVLLSLHRIDRPMVGYREELREELGEALVEHLLAQWLLEVLSRV